MTKLFFSLLFVAPLYSADKQPTTNVVVTTTQTVTQASNHKKHERKAHYKVERQVIPERPKNDDQVEAGCCCFFRDSSK